MLRRHMPLRRGLGRWALAVGRSFKPRTRIVARNVRNRLSPRRLVSIDDGAPVTVDVWAEADELAATLIDALAEQGITASRTWLWGPAVLVDSDESEAAIAALRGHPEAGSWWARGQQRRYVPLTEVTVQPTTGRWRVRRRRGGAGVETGLTGPGVGVILQFVGHENDQHQPLRVTGYPHAFQMIEPIDVVYTWVDDTDPDWQRQRATAVPTDRVTSDALSPARHVDHGELRYSLRSLAGFANWVRHIWIVTSGQVPSWLNVDHPKLTVVSHREIFTDQSALPTFNSHAIESQLHHIDGLAEHFLYLNDDVFFGRPVSPELFFHGNGVAKFMASDVTIDVDPGDFPRTGAAAAARRNRDLIEQLWGRSITHRMKHVPHAHRRSSLLDLEQKVPDTFATVAHSRFRGVDDVSIASDLGHYHAYALGLAATGSLGFRYVDLASDALEQYFADLLARRSFDVFCINDTRTGNSAERSALVSDFLNSYFPAPGPYERAG